MGWSLSGHGKLVLAVHGGAGDVPPDRREVHRQGCEEAARRGYEVLLRGGSALDAVEEAAVCLEDLPQFNAGTGASLNEVGEVEHDASIMDGALLRGGGVCTLRGFANPIRVARKLLEEGRHVLLSDEGAAIYALSKGFARVGGEALTTDAAREALERWRAGGGTTGWAGGTIGVVARDAAGHLAQATSTGGTIGKMRGRVGDSPLLGAGGYADDATCAVSATGDGEAVIRVGMCLRIAEFCRAGASAEGAAREGLGLLDRVKGNGGVIVVDRLGRYGLARSTVTMSHAVVTETGVISGV